MKKILDKITTIMQPYLYNSPSFGRLKFWALYYIQKILAKCGYGMHSRSIEHGWCLEQITKDSKILEVGCTTSYFSHELAARTKRLYGLDVRPCPSKPPLMVFSQQDIRKTEYPENFFDIIILVSTLEHIGLGGYGDYQQQNGDIEAVAQLRRILIPGGKILITVPFSGSFTVCGITRIYDEDRIKKICESFKVIKNDYFIHQKKNWVKVTKSVAQTSSAPKLGKYAMICLELSK
jgi:SAM-dependent methyltransferase